MIFLKIVTLFCLSVCALFSTKIYLCCTELKSVNRVSEAACKYSSSLNPASSTLSVWVRKTAVKFFHVGPRSSCNEKQISDSYLSMFPPPVKERIVMY